LSAPLLCPSSCVPAGAKRRVKIRSCATPGAATRIEARNRPAHPIAPRLLARRPPRRQAPSRPVHWAAILVNFSVPRPRHLPGGFDILSTHRRRLDLNLPAPHAAPAPPTPYLRRPCPNSCVPVMGVPVEPCPPTMEAARQPLETTPRAQQSRFRCFRSISPTSTPAFPANHHFRRTATCGKKKCRYSERLCGFFRRAAANSRSLRIAITLATSSSRTRAQLCSRRIPNRLAYHPVRLSTRAILFAGTCFNPAGITAVR